MGVALFAGIAYEALADGVTLGEPPVQEKYWGRILNADERTVVFDIECRGETQKLSWTRIHTIEFNDRCSPPAGIQAGGFQIKCDDPQFMFVDSQYVTNVMLKRFVYADGVLEFLEGGEGLDAGAKMDFRSKKWTLANGEEIEIGGAAGERFRAFIMKIDVQNTCG